MSVFESYVADIAATELHNIAIGCDPLGNALKRSPIESSTWRCFFIVATNFLLSDAEGSSPLINKKQVSRKSEFSASWSIG